MFAQLEVDLDVLAARIFFPKPPTWLSHAAIQQQWQEFNFPNRSLKKKPTPLDWEEFETSKPLLLRSAASAETDAPAIFVVDTMWHSLLMDDKRLYARDKPMAPSRAAESSAEPLQ